MFRTLFLLLALAGLSGCGEGTAAIVPAKGQASAPSEAGYLTPPRAETGRIDGDKVLLTGAAPARSRVRLASPQGEAVYAQASTAGAWALTLPASPRSRIFGLSARADGRTAQAEGYLLLTPAAEPVLLRAGAGAQRPVRKGRSGLDAVDFDREGGAVVSGRAPAGAALSVLVDGRQMAEGRADADGRYSIALTRPLPAGAHQIDIFGDAAENPVMVDATPAAPISGGPFRSASVAGGLRIDWLTPGGGPQTTILLE